MDSSAPFPLVGNLELLVFVLLLFNIVLIGGLILLAFRAVGYKRRVEELEAELGYNVDEALRERERLAAQAASERPPVRRRTF